MNKEHKCYDASDFTEEEVNNKNKLAVAVLEWGMKICKYCGKQGEELEGKCQSKHFERKWR